MDGAGAKKVDRRAGELLRCMVNLVEKKVDEEEKVEEERGVGTPARSILPLRSPFYSLSLSFTAEANSGAAPFVTGSGAGKRSADLICRLSLSRVESAQTRERDFSLYIYEFELNFLFETSGDDWNGS